MTTPTTTTTKLSKRTDDKGCRWYVSEPDARGCWYEVWPVYKKWTIFGDTIGGPSEWLVERRFPDTFDERGRLLLGRHESVRGWFPTMRDARRRVAELLSDGGAW